jgi:hypothetical protein
MYIDIVDIVNVLFFVFTVIIILKLYKLVEKTYSEFLEQQKKACKKTEEFIDDASSFMRDEENHKKVKEACIEILADGISKGLIKALSERKKK